MELKSRKKSPQKFHCECCDYYTSKKSDFDKHELTRKHLMELNGINWKSKSRDFICKSCNRSYKSQSGLWKHEKKCQSQIEEVKKIQQPNQNNLQDVIVSLVQENKEMRQLIVQQQQSYKEQLDSLIPNIGSNNNNKFNLNIFLNEHCKDALNIMEFVNNLPIQIDDLEKTGKMGYINGMTDIIVNGLKELEFNKRPLHCSDLKRETIYIKDNNIWEKDNEEKDKLKKAISCIKRRNLQQLPEWMEQHPKCASTGSKENEDYLQIISNSMITDDSKESKILVKEIMKKVVIDK
jgi:hypothetical protein